MHLVTSRIIPLFCDKSCDPFLHGAMRQTHTTIRLDEHAAADEPLYSGVDLLRFPALRGGFPTFIRALRRYMVVFVTGRLMCFAARSAFNDD